MSIKQSFLPKQCVVVCSCRRTVHCSIVSLCYAVEFTVMLSYTVQILIYTIIYIQILTMHKVFPSLQQPALSKYICTFTDNTY
jgi:hypothetical protein